MTEAQENKQPGIQIVSQYIKDFSFENPNAPESLTSGWPAPDTNVHISLQHKHVRDNAHEATIRLRVEAKKKDDGKVCFIIDLSFCALAVLQNVPAENIQPVMMVEVPKLLFPFVRQTVADVTAQGGYPPLFLAPISFEAMYMGEMRRLQAEKGQSAVS